MSARARKATVGLTIAGVDVSSDIESYLLSLTYTDSEEDAADDIQLQLHDRDAVWLESWLDEIVNAAAASPIGGGSPGTGWNIGDEVTINGQPQFSSYGIGDPGAAVSNRKGKITFLNLGNGIPYPIHVDYLGWFAESQVRKEGGSKNKPLRLKASIYCGGRLNCGEFELDSVAVSGPPSCVVLKGTSLPFSSQIRQTKHSRAWEACTLSGIAGEMAALGGMTLMFESESDPFYTRIEQTNTSDIDFLSQLCHNAGLSLKAACDLLIIFDQATYESKPPIALISPGCGYIKYKLNRGTAGTQFSSCRVSCIDPATGKCIEGIASMEDFGGSQGSQQLEITEKVTTAEEAKKLAEKQLRLHNKFCRTATFTYPGEPNYVAGVTAMLSGWGGWDGKYIIREAKHTVSGTSGYTTEIQLRRVLEGY